jgi:hypothetical protein
MGANGLTAAMLLAMCQPCAGLGSVFISYAPYSHLARADAIVLGRAFRSESDPAAAGDTGEKDDGIRFFVMETLYSRVKTPTPAWLIVPKALSWLELGEACLAPEQA